MEGMLSLVDRRPAEFLRQSLKENSSGSLVFFSPAGTFTVVFRDGRIVQVTGGDAQWRFGEYLVARGALKSDHMSALLAALRGSQPFGQTLVESGILSPADVERHLADLGEILLAQVLTLTQGTVAFVPELLVAGPNLAFPRLTPALLLGACRYLDHASPLDLASPKTWSAVMPPEEEDLADLPLSPVEFLSLSRMRGAIRREDLKTLSPEHAEFERMLLALWILNRIELVARRRRDSAPVAVPELTESLLASFEQQDHYQILGIPTDAPPALIEQRLEVLRAFFRPENFPPSDRVRAERMARRFDEIEQTLLDPDKRRAYDSRRGTGRPVPEAGAEDRSERAELQKRLARQNVEKAQQRLRSDHASAALALLEQAVVFDPGSAEAWVLLARCRAKEAARRPEAIESYQRALRLDPRRADLWLELAEVFEATQMFERADQCYREVLKLEPTNVVATRALKTP